MGNKILGSYIREQRKLRHMSLKQLANVCGISVAQLSRVERGERLGKEVSPSIELLVKITNALQLSLEKVLIEVGYMPSSTTRRYVYYEIEDFLQREQMQEIHQLELDALDEVEKESLYETILYALDVISYKYK